MLPVVVLVNVSGQMGGSDKPLAGYYKVGQYVFNVVDRASDNKILQLYKQKLVDSQILWSENARAALGEGI